jgi:hypothetical protein
MLEMKLFLICVALAIPGFCQAEIPKLLTQRAFNSASLAEAANHFIAIGEQATFNELEAFIAEDSTHTNYRFSRGYNVEERIAWIFRIIYEPQEPIPMHIAKTGAWIPGIIIPLRAPNFGWLQIPDASMPAEKWPLYPLAFSGSTYIVLKERYTPKGVPETINHYMEYCKDNGVFRKTPVAVPTREQALKDMDQLRQSTSWQAIKWVNNGGIGFPHGEEWTWDYIQSQAHTIPEATVAKEQPNVTVKQLSAR